MNIDKQKYEQLKSYWNCINNSFSDKLIYRVGESQGFYSEINAMLEVMLWCYNRNIKFTMYADGANFGGGNGWTAFFEPFCEENHDIRNEHVNRRHRINWKHQLWRLDAWLFKKKYKAKYLTQDVFFPCINRDIISSKEEKEKVCLPGLEINSYDDFARLAQFVLRYNVDTQNEILKRINSLNLPDEYISVQIRNGDKCIEYKNLMSAKDVVVAYDKFKIRNNNLFVFTDDYRTILELKRIKPELNIYTLTQENEVGYDNVAFQKIEWKEKKQSMLKLFAMVEVCLKSKLHLGCAQSCTNNFIKSIKKEYVDIWSDNETAREWVVYK